MTDPTTMPWYCKGSLPRIRQGLEGEPRGYYKVWDGTSSVSLEPEPKPRPPHAPAHTHRAALGRSAATRAWPWPSTPGRAERWAALFGAGRRQNHANGARPAARYQWHTPTPPSPPPPLPFTFPCPRLPPSSPHQANSPKWVVLVSEGAHVNGYKVTVNPDGGCTFAGKSFPDIHGVVDFIRLRPLQGKDGHELRLARDDDRDERRPNVRSRVARPSAEDREALAARFTQTGRGGGGGGGGGGRTQSSPNPAAAMKAAGASRTLQKPPRARDERSGSDSASPHKTVVQGGQHKHVGRAKPTPEERAQLLAKFNKTAGPPRQAAPGGQVGGRPQAQGTVKARPNPAAAMKAAGASKTLPMKRNVPKTWTEIHLPRTEGSKVGMSLQKYQGEGAGLVILKVEPGTDAANAVPALRPGMRIIQVNGIDTASNAADVRKQFQLGCDLEMRVDMPKDATKSMAQAPTTSRQRQAIFIAPLDAAAFDKLDVRITSPQEVGGYHRVWWWWWWFWWW